MRSLHRAATIGTLAISRNGTGAKQIVQNNEDGIKRATLILPQSLQMQERRTGVYELPRAPNLRKIENRRA